MNRLSKELYFEIWKNLDSLEICSLSQICKYWNKVKNTEIIKNLIFEKDKYWLDYTKRGLLLYNNDIFKLLELSIKKRKEYVIDILIRYYKIDLIKKYKLDIIPACRNDDIISRSCKNENLPIIKRLLCFYNKDYINNLFKISIKKSQLDIVNYLLSYKNVDPSIDNNYAFRYAVITGDRSLVAFLLNYSMIDTRINPGDLNNYAIQMASERKDKIIVDMLKKHSLIDKRIDASLIK